MEYCNSDLHLNIGNGIVHQNMLLIGPVHEHYFPTSKCQFTLANNHVSHWVNEQLLRDYRYRRCAHRRPRKCSFNITRTKTFQSVSTKNSVNFHIRQYLE